MPLFLLAFPMLFFMLYSGSWAISRPPGQSIKTNGFRETDVPKSVNAKTESQYTTKVLRRLAIPQILIAVLALTNFHVQTILRLSSGYPVIYWWLASALMAQGKESPPNTIQEKWVQPKLVVRAMIMYAIIQGGLFASFLPPA